MKTKISPAVIGAFVIGGFALLFLALISFGGVSFFSKPQRFVVLFNESVHGLDLGSPVKLRGVRVGRVVDLNLRYDARSGRSVVAVVCEIGKDAMTDGRGAGIDVASREELQRLVDRGMRAQLGVLGLATGLLYVELDIVDPKEFPADKSVADGNYVVVPALPSAISAFQASASEILSKIKRIDFAGLSDEVKALVAQTRRQVAGIDVRGTVDQWKRTGAALEALASDPAIRRTLDELNAAAKDVRAAVARLDGQIEPAGREVTQTMAEVRRSLQAFNTAADSVRGFMAAQSGVGADLGVTLGRLNEAADAVGRLAEFIERNPNALLTGRRRAP
ncbi:MAG: MlaD family protein [Opitutaceae bacterium]